MWKYLKLGRLHDKSCTQPMMSFLLKRQLCKEDELARRSAERNRAVWAKQIQVLIKKRDNLESMSLDIQQQQVEIEAKLRLNKQQLKEASEEWDKLNKDP